MREISKEYLLLFNTLTDTEAALNRLYLDLIEAQRRAEELYMSAEATPDGTREAG
jgi:hypothetical protein